MSLLRANNISVSFGGVKAVQNVSFSIEQGEVLGLIGPNGSGKTTCVNLISGVNTLDTGEIVFNGIKLHERLKIHERVHLGITRTFQTPKPFGNLTVFDNVFSIALQLYSFKDAEKKTIEILEKLNLIEVKDVISTQLPIEMRKWLDLARTLSLRPKLIMMDEVMAGLNPSEITRSEELVRRINSDGITILFIEHIMSAVVNVCDRVIVLNEGKLLCEGIPDEVLLREEVIKAYIGGSTKYEDT